MVKIIISERQYHLIKERLVEEIKPEEAYNVNGTIQTLIDGKRGVGFIGGANREDLKKIKQSGLNFIRVGFNQAYIIYNNGYEDNAQELANISIKNKGYLPIKSPEETYVIGILLGYNKESVKDFVSKKFPDFVFY